MAASSFLSEKWKNAGESVDEAFFFVFRKGECFKCDLFGTV